MRGRRAAGGREEVPQFVVAISDAKPVRGKSDDSDEPAQMALRHVIRRSWLPHIRQCDPQRVEGINSAMARSTVVSIKRKA